MLDYKSKSTLIRNYLNPLLESGKLELTIPEKPNSRLQKYKTINNLKE